MTEVEVCTAALLVLGAQPITSLSENTDRARTCAGLYPIVLDSLLREHTWACATKRITLAPDAEAPEYDYTYQFTLPSDFLRLLSVGEYGYEVDHRIEGRKLLCDENPCKLRYIYRNEIEATWDTMLVECMVMALAARMAYAVTQSAALAEVLEKNLAALLQKARSVDAMDDPPVVLGDYGLFRAGF